MDTRIELSFIQSFVQRERRGRAQFELFSPKKRSAFLNRLCHSYADVLDMRFLTPVPHNQADQRLVNQHLIGKQSPRMVYVISMSNDIDGAYVELHAALAHVFFSGMPSIVLCIPTKLGYFQAEQEVGSPPRYFLERP